jgi:anaerobic ribonucleoside-triphosphate reductase activating protein
MRCDGCCNPEFLEYVDADWMTVDEVVEKIRSSKVQNNIEGVTFLGGEPFTQPEALAKVAEVIRQEGLSVMIFTGFIKEKLEKSKKQGIQDLLAQTDLLVDGPFDNTLIDSKRRWIGSTNQRTLALTDLYEDLANNWDETPETIEFRMVVNGDKFEIQVNGSPFLLDLAGQFAWDSSSKGEDDEKSECDDK